jgi:predicted lysophospholipase L1 biosynthesis ABC-type transport system permease subunit
VAIVNQALADALWPGQDPLGRTFRRGHDDGVLQVVGVVPTARYRSLLEAPRPFVYLPLAQSWMPGATLHLRADGDARALAPAVERLVAELDPALPVYRVGTLADRLDQSLGAQRSAASLVGAYGVLALLLAAVGLYGSMGYTVARRTREIGVRMAVGASGRDVLRQVLGEALRIALLGAALGLVAAWPAARLLESQLFGVAPGDPATFVAVAALLAVVALLAAIVPARRATRVDPLVALREE